MSAVNRVNHPNLTHYNKFENGGHFAAWEQPQLFSDEVRAGFRSLRIAKATTLNR
jgi:pimeloyl-ACP methyl ester carboxylesterase